VKFLAVVYTDVILDTDKDSPKGWQSFFKDPKNMTKEEIANFFASFYDLRDKEYTIVSDAIADRQSEDDADYLVEKDKGSIPSCEAKPLSLNELLTLGTLMQRWILNHWPYESCGLTEFIDARETYSLIQRHCGFPNEATPNREEFKKQHEPFYSLGEKDQTVI
jgi:hypothetical protein